MLSSRLVVTALVALMSISSAAPPGASTSSTGGHGDHSAAGQWLEVTGSTMVAQSVHDWNNYGPDQSKVLTYGDYQYAIFYDAALHLTLSRRDLRSDDVQLITFPEQLTNPGDTHHNAVLGFSEADGRIHLSYDHHNHPLRYRRSEAGVLSEPPETLSLAHFYDPEPLIDGGSLEQSVTYPRFVTDPDGGLLLIYRQGGSGNGTNYIHRYDAETDDWSRDGALLVPDGTYEPWNGSSSRNAYLFDVLFDVDGRMHLAWTWRETSAWPSNHGIHYAYSDDLGVSCFNSDGVAVADTADGDPIELADDTEVVDVPVNAYLMNQSVQTLDADGQPHIITYMSTQVPATDETRDLHYTHFWRTADGEWHQNFIDEVGVDLPEVRTLTHEEPIRRGDAFVDDQNVLHFYAIVSGALYHATATADSGWQDWTVRRLSDAGIGLLDQGPKFDRSRWGADGVISMMISSVQDDGTTAFSAQEFERTPGSAPAQPALTLEPANEGIELVIDGAIGAEAFTIERRAESEPHFALLEAEYSRGTMQRSFIDTTATTGDSYTYRVRAVNSDGSSAPAKVSGALEGPWSDYTVGVDLTIDVWSAGVVFRATDTENTFDDGNFYWWAIQPDREDGQLLRLIFTDGEIERLDPVPLPDSVTAGSAHHLEIEAAGNQITTRIDGDVIDQLTDDTHTHGTIGFRHGGPDGDRAQYDNLTVTAPDGVVLHTEHFGQPTRLPCGSLELGILRVDAGERCNLPVQTIGRYEKPE